MLGVFKLSMQAGRNSTMRAAPSLSTLGACWCQWVPKSEQDDDHDWIVWGGGSDLGLWVVTFVLFIVVYVSLWTITQAALLLTNEGIPQALNLSSLLFFCSAFTARKIPHSTERTSFFLHFHQNSIALLVLRKYWAVEEASGCLLTLHCDMCVGMQIKKFVFL